ncbi:hypothetical protein [uncultured Dokdonia sp.]|uniref:hypothetical protein n=1 Tax=Dokdonia sp. Asnod2-E02 TaxID=3160574 RepID=UPI0026057DEA|nr:hypothetical protein [uncultured Dokdonia sp.]
MKTISPITLWLITLGVVVCFAGTVNAQIDAPRASIEIKGEQPNEVPTEVFVSPTAPKKDNTIQSGSLIFKSKIKLSDPFAAKEKREINLIKGDDFAKKDFSALENKMNNSNAKDKEKLKPEYYRDQYLGDFKSGSKFVNFTYRDHGTVDGDLVSVSVNGTVIHPRIFLEGEFQGFYLDLVKGFNKIEVKALNQGSVGANTAQFVMYDDERQVISSNSWFLASGFTATVIIVKEE